MTAAEPTREADFVLGRRFLDVVHLIGFHDAKSAFRLAGIWEGDPFAGMEDIATELRDDIANGLLTEQPNSHLLF